MTFSPTTRASLLLRLRDPQDHAAWVEFVSLYEPVAYRLLRRHGLQDADAREVMQEMFLAVSRSIDRWDPSSERGSFRGWLRQVIRNLVINWLKHSQRRIRPSGGNEWTAMLEQVVGDSGPESSVFEEELKRALFRKAADQVRAEVQTSTWQAFWETTVLGVSPAEVAKKLGMEVGAVRVAKCRVLARVRSAVAELEKAT
jgi:RNA polymerase sigma factor (sigma-70 family)